MEPIVRPSLPPTQVSRLVLFLTVCCAIVVKIFAHSQKNNHAVFIVQIAIEQRRKHRLFCQDSPKQVHCSRGLSHVIVREPITTNVWMVADTNTWMTVYFLASPAHWDQLTTLSLGVYTATRSESSGRWTNSRFREEMEPSVSECAEGWRTRNRPCSPVKERVSCVFSQF